MSEFRKATSEERARTEGKPHFAICWDGKLIGSIRANVNWADAADRGQEFLIKLRKKPKGVSEEEFREHLEAAFRDLGKRETERLQLVQLEPMIGFKRVQAH